MIRKTSILSLIALCLTLTLKAQDSIKKLKNHILGIYTGYSYHILNDDIISPLLYKGSNTTFEFDYKYFGINTIQLFSVIYNKSTLKSSISDSYYAPHTMFQSASLNYSFHKRLFFLSKINTIVYAGSNFISEINYSDHFYDSYNDAITANWITSLGVSLILKKKFINHANDDFYFQFNMPLIGYSKFNARYNVKVGQMEGNFITVNQLFEFKTRLSYTKSISKHLGLEIRHQFHFYSLTEYQDLFRVRYMNNQFLAGLIIKL